MIDLTFHVETEDEAKTYIDGPRWRGLVQGFDNYLRSEAKYKDDAAARTLREELFLRIQEAGLCLWEE